MIAVRPDNDAGRLLARLVADQRAHGGSVHMADVGDMGSLRDSDW